MEIEPAHVLHVATGGDEAFSFLRGNGLPAAVPSPDLIFLELNLPGTDGRVLLAEIKSNVRFRIIPVIVLTASELSDDVRRAYDLFANCYLRKPLDLTSYLDALRTCVGFWSTTVRLPTA